MFEAFDMPDTNETCSRRTQTVTPSQSLELLNNELVVDWAKAFAGRVLNDGGMTQEAQVDRAYKLAYSRTPSEEERSLALTFLRKQVHILAEQAKHNQRLIVPQNLPAGVI